MSEEANNPVTAKVLVVDDMSDNLLLLRLSLQHMGYEVITASNGEEAVEVAKMARPDLILMDLGMPQLDGVAATRLIRENADLERVPIIAVTAFTTEQYRGAAYNAGFDGYITKPIDFERLSKLIDNLLTKGSNRE